MHAIDGVSLEVHRGETLGIVGESGSGKSTLARCILRLQEVTAGRIVFDGEDITKLSQRRLRPVRREMQMIFQDPFGALNPRRRVGSIIGDPLAIHTKGSGAERKRQVQELMELVGLNPEHFNRFPAEFSGGQRQRIGVARALALRPKLIVCDEPVSALDVSIQAQILNLLVDLQEEFKLTYVFIAHDLSVGTQRQQPDRGDVPRQGASRRPRRTTSTGPHATLTARRCCPRRPSRIQTSRTVGSGSCSSATCPRRSTLRRAAGSARAARGSVPTARLRYRRSNRALGDPPAAHDCLLLPPRRRGGSHPHRAGPYRKSAPVRLALRQCASPGCPRPLGGGDRAGGRDPGPKPVAARFREVAS